MTYRDKFSPNTSVGRPVVGLVPAAGQARRLGELPFSKELFPVDASDEPGAQKPKAIVEFLIEYLRASDIDRAFVILRDGKWDIPGHLGDGSRFDVDLGYLMMNQSYGVPYTLDQAFEHTRDCNIALGFPDIVMSPPDAFRACLHRLEETGADAVLGGFPADNPQGVDMVVMTPNGQLKELIVKPKTSSLPYTWAIATWTPVFSEFMHDFLIGYPKPPQAPRELQVADVFTAAASAGLDIRVEIVSELPFVDIGTPQGLARFARNRDRLLSTQPAATVQKAAS